MLPTIDQNMLYTIVVALFVYDLMRMTISIFTGSLTASREFKKGESGSRSPYTGTGSGPGGMIVKGLDSIRGDEQEGKKDGAQG
jgi:hypothetical protein